jgi:hypothetical protein
VRKRIFRRGSASTVTRRVTVVLGAVAALTVGLGGGAAYAFFNGSGAGSGAATTGSSSSITVLAATGTVTNKLAPGTTGDLRLSVNNPNGRAVTITGIAGNGVVSAAGGIGACSTTGVSVPSQSGLSVSVASGSSVSVVIPGAVAMNATSSTGCQGATFQVPVTLTVQEG